ncbi:response regulator [Subsaximicrobium wynnwilliamsii]|nr:response regulator [Subsaximicrobium wynnwilliamsii]
MNYPKPTFIAVLLLFFGFQNLFSQELLVFDKQSKCSFNNERVETLIQNDSLYKATILLNEALAFTKKYGFTKYEAQAYNGLGMVFSEMGNNNSAKMYYYKALSIYDSIHEPHGRDYVLSNLANTYLLYKKYKQFDSIYPIAQSSAKKLNSELFFINLENEIKRNYYTNRNDALIKLAEYSFNQLARTDFDKLSYSRDYKSETLEKRLKYNSLYYKAIGLIKLGHFDEGYTLLFSIDIKDFKKSIVLNNDANRQLSTLNYYKFRYFHEFKKQKDSAVAYLLKSDEYKYSAMLEYERATSQNGELIYKILKTEEQLSSANKLRINDAKLSRSFIASTIISSILLVVVVIFFFYYYKTRKNIETINEELKNSNKKLIKRDKDRSEFFSVLSHELRTPIYGISGLSTLIEQEQSEVKKEAYLKSLISSSNYISILIDNILQATRAKFEDKQLRLKPGRIDPILQNVINTVKVAAENKGLNLFSNIAHSDEDEYIMIDKVAFSQIMINLAYNAIRYTNKGFISIDVSEVNRTDAQIELLFEVKDSGIGISEEHRQTVFSAFENKMFLQKNSSGSGLGLYIVKTLLKSHGTEIDFVSKPNKGSSFFFNVTFDLCEKPETVAHHEDLEARIDNHVLIVDDNKINLLITKKTLERIPGCTCETASNGKEAISLVKQKDFDMVLMDINMPEMDGFEVTKHIRLFNPNIPVLALTALNSGEVSAKAEACGMNQVITKPYNFDDFKAIVRGYSKVYQV